MVKKTDPTKISSRKQSLILFLGLVVALICLSTFKGIYVNLNNAYGDVYNPTLDLIISAFGGILLGFILGYWFKSKR